MIRKTLYVLYMIVGYIAAKIAPVEAVPSWSDPDVFRLIVGVITILVCFVVDALVERLLSRREYRQDNK